MGRATQALNGQAADELVELLFQAGDVGGEAVQRGPSLRIAAPDLRPQRGNRDQNFSLLRLQFFVPADEGVKLVSGVGKQLLKRAQLGREPGLELAEDRRLLGKRLHRLTQAGKFGRGPVSLLFQPGLKGLERAGHKIVEDTRLALEPLAEEQAPGPGHGDGTWLARRVCFTTFGCQAGRKLWCGTGRRYGPTVPDK